MNATEVKRAIDPAQIKQIWKYNFKASNEWLDMYFNRVYRSEDLLWREAADDDDFPASSLLLQRYTMQWEGKELPIGYISGAVTDRRYRGRGYMRELMHTAINESHLRGDVLVTLIPARRSLYYFYAKTGFSTVFYIDEARFTDVHRFIPQAEYKIVDKIDTPEVYSLVDSLLRSRGNVVLHSIDDFHNILKDIEIDGGEAVAVTDEGGNPVAFALVSPENDGHITVREVLWTDDDAMEGVLDVVKQRHPKAGITLVQPAGTVQMPIHSRAMARIVNADKLLKAYAANHPDVHCSIRLHDDLLPDNNHIWILEKGEALINDGFGGRLDLDVPQDVMLAILCSDPSTGSIFNLPTRRPSISMMMD